MRAFCSLSSAQLLSILLALLYRRPGRVGDGSPHLPGKGSTVRWQSESMSLDTPKKKTFPYLHDNVVDTIRLESLAVVPTNPKEQSCSN